MSQRKFLSNWKSQPDYATFQLIRDKHYHNDIQIYTELTDNIKWKQRMCLTY